MRVGCRPRIAPGEFGGHRLAQHETVGGAAGSDHGGIVGRLMARVDGGPISGRHIAGVDQILDRDGHPGERPARAAAVKGDGGVKSGGRIEMGPGAYRVVTRGDPLQMGADHAFGGQCAGGDLGHDGRRGRHCQIGHKLSLGGFACRPAGG